MREMLKKKVVCPAYFSVYPKYRKSKVFRRKK